ncbi:hypothetical protein AB431_23895 [Mycobacterium sp. EPa45]|nr:hypothetical protein AB431_23895 [Mycobacterium sp. EPa45]
MVGGARITTEIDADLVVGRLSGGDVVDRIRILRIRCEISVTVINRDRPEPVDGNVSEGEPIVDTAVVVRWDDIEVKGVPFRE